ncbi:hypothetical protein [Nocardia bovistercoris]|uniref:Uncharacterized protein n=1 Tax=Nocardia bovistercoris TaxID=2785916 RepID=A0A931IHL6_9NOCA|nr:hypothetical protein [Nocardia bovistercoris]MBH0781589.1 hypothetical protein [Nocardia bovistercoris]
MRTHFEPEDIDAFEAAKDLLIRRCTAWAAEQGRSVDPFALAAAVDFRHEGVDGRLGYWTAALAEEFLLSHAPRALSVSAPDAVEIPDSLRVLVGYLHSTGLADPGGDPLPEVDAALTNSAADFATAMADESNFGPAKFWLMTAMRGGIDPTDGPAMAEFFDDVNAGRVDYDENVLEHIAERQVRAGGGPGRMPLQLPVSLAGDAELAATADLTPIVARLRALVEWVGDGRALTTTGNLRLADARELVVLLDTGDGVDQRIGDRVFRTKSSAELPGLTYLTELAKKIRLVRVVKNRLVRVAKAAPLLRDGLALWTAAFDAQPALGLLIPPASWAADHTRMLHSILDDVLPDVLNTLYGLPEPMPVVRLTESVWSACAAFYYLDDLDPAILARWRQGIDTDLRRVLDRLAETGAVELTVGRPDPMYRADLDADWDSDALPPDARDRLRIALAPEVAAVELISLTPLATRAVRARLLGEGRHAPLVGELVEAEPAQLLGVVAEHYSQETADAEIAGWLAAHGGPERGLSLLLDGVRGCPFRTRAYVMLDLLADATPDRSAFLRGLRTDRQIGPIAVQLLINDGEIAMDELDPDEGLRGMAEQFITLLEAHGPDTVTGMLADLPDDQAPEIVDALEQSGHPDRVGLNELITVARAHLAERRPTVLPFRAASRSSRPRRPRGRRK